MNFTITKSRKVNLKIQKPEVHVQIRMDAQMPIIIRSLNQRYITSSDILVFGLIGLKPITFIKSLF